MKNFLTALHLLFLKVAIFLFFLLLLLFFFLLLLLLFFLTAGLVEMRVDQNLPKATFVDDATTYPLPREDLYMNSFYLKSVHYVKYKVKLINQADSAKINTFSSMSGPRRKRLESGAEPGVTQSQSLHLIGYCSWATGRDWRLEVVL